MHQLFGKNEVDFVATASKEDLKDYWVFYQHWLSEAAQLKLLERGEEELIDSYICHYSFIGEALLKFLDFNDKDLVEAYILMCHDCSFPPEAELKLIRMGDKQLLKAYFRDHDLCHKAMSIFLDFDDEELVALYLLNCHEKLSPENENKLMDLGNEKLFSSYVRWHSLRPDAQVKLVKLRNRDLLKAYVSKGGSFREEAFPLFIEFVIELGDADLARSYQWTIYGKDREVLEEKGLLPKPAPKRSVKKPKKKAPTSKKSATSATKKAATPTESKKKVPTKKAATPTEPKKAPTKKSNQ